MSLTALIPKLFTAAAQPSGSCLRRKCACGGSSEGECESCKKKLQRRATASGPDTAPSIVHNVLRTPGQPLDKQTRSFFQPLFGHDFARVRVHTSEDAARSARSVNALAYTVGHHVVFDSGQYAPGTPAGRQLIAHELTHVLQQGNGEDVDRTLRVGPAGDPYEQQADQIAASVPATRSSPGRDPLQPRAARRNQILPLSNTAGPRVIQRQVPTGISLKGIKSFGHADLKDEEDKKKFLTNIGAVTLMQLTPGGDYTAGQKRGDCTKEFLTEVANTCPTPAKPFCGGDRCLEVGKNTNTGDPQTGMLFNEGPDTFVDRHIARYDTSLLAGSGKSQCSVVCHQTYKYRTVPDRQYHDLGSFYIIRNFRAGSFTPTGSTTPLNITTGSIQKVPAAASAPSKDDFAKTIAPGLVRSGALVDAPPVSNTQAAPQKLEGGK
jgi:Domain of unknown function (DUF4157)